MPRAKKTDVVPEETQTQALPVAAVADILGKAVAQAIETARPQKKTVSTMEKNTPWTPPKGTPRSKLKRKMYQHGLMMNPDVMTNEEIDLCNKLRPGNYCDEWVRVRRRRDRGVDISYPIKSNAQRLRLVHQYGVRNLKELLELCIREAENPKPKEAEDF